ncbi:tectonic-2 [Plakobranchus ocellatus]|uniref:Tectonic-2 n=1 Tax=Plakobranchus ocellatus TaxID=259542 RepID=A0AAV3ZBD2_9GAST|nr:tectonic-2 [Plakobranchus ocellatus]
MGVFFLKRSAAQNRGVVFIGNSTTDLATEYTYSYTQIRSQQSIPIFATIFANGNPSTTVAKSEDITISCSVLNNGAGFTSVSIQDLILLGTDATGTLALVPQSNGRTNSVQCAAQSVTGTCPIATGTALFCPDTSQSNVVSVTVRPPATISLCELELYVMNGASTFEVRLSEPALTDVTVQCSVTTTSTWTVTINDQTLSAGVERGQISFSVSGGNDSFTASVTCRARSVTGSQFVLADSVVAASTAVFLWKSNSLTFQPEYVRVYNTTFTSFLALSFPMNAREVSVACRTYTESSLQTALQTATTTPNCAQIDSPSSGQTVPWRVKTAFFNLESDTSTTDDFTYFQTVTTERVQLVTSAVTEVILTRCCVRNVPASAQFQGLHATVVAVAELAPFICEQCNNTVENPKEERVLQNPGYVEVAPCACDLTQDKCDFNCCCDEECSDNQRARFSVCIAGLPGGEPADPEEYRCSSNAFNLPDWHLMTCVYWESNAYLGMYYMNQARVAETDFTVVVSNEYKGRFSFSKPEALFRSQENAYSHGASLVTVREDVEVGPQSRNILALPRAGDADGACDFLSPVRFLVNTQASCSSVLVPETCSALSRFSGRIYAVSSAISGCSQSFKVASSLTGNTVAPADVRYYCATDLSPYLPAAGTALNELPPTQGSSFGGALANENCSTPCSSQTCIDYNSGRAADSSQPLPAPCPWDDGTTSPVVPNLNNNVCENVVLDVRYRFEWSGSQITRLSADVILGNVRNVTPGLEVMLTQKFQADWIHQGNGSVYSLSDNFDSTTEAYQRSGSAGYDDGAPLISGCPVSSQTTQEFDRVATNFERQMAVWRPGVDGLCENANRQGLTFADDTFSSCALRLTADDLELGCEDLRQTIFNHLNVLMPSDLIGRYGYNNARDLAMWIPVLRQTLNETEDNSTVVVTNDTEAFRTWADSITGACRVPSSINLNVMYAQTGAVNGYPRQEVIGAYISYTESTWSMDCQGAQAARCAAGSTITQNFFLSSSVQYTRVDAAASQSSETLFHTRCDPYDFASSSSCERFFSNVYREECYWETCWQELAYPVKPAAERGPEYDWRLQALPVFLALVLGIVGYVSVAKPGWS